MSKPILAVLVLSFALLGCGGTNYNIHKLPSGRQIKVMHIGTILFKSGERALKLDYQTDLKISDSLDLRNEVKDIWQVLKDDADKAQVTGAIISAQEVPSGFIFKTGHAYNFVFEKQSDSTWKGL